MKNDYKTRNKIFPLILLNSFYSCRKHGTDESTWLQTAGWGTSNPSNNVRVRVPDEVVHGLNVKCVPDSYCR